jgi:tape measure domain-containing protein
MAITIQDQVVVDMRADIRRLKRDLAAAKAATKATNSGMRAQWKATAASIRSTAAQLSRLSVTMAVTMGGPALVSVVRHADAWSLLASRIKLVSDSYDETTDKRRKLFEVSQETRTDIVSLTNLYTRIARNTRQLNIEDEKRLRLTKLIAKALIISGAETRSAEAALVQFTQGLAANALRGQELNSVMEQTPRITQALADGMAAAIKKNKELAGVVASSTGVTIGELRKLAAEGKITTKVVFDAMLSQEKKINEEFKQMAKTTGQAGVQLSNAWKRFVGNLDQAIGMTQYIVKHIDLLREALRDEDKEMQGYQNHYIGMITSVLAYADKAVDVLLYLSAASYKGYTTALDTAALIGSIFTDKLMSMFDTTFRFLEKIKLETKLAGMVISNSLHFKIGDIEIAGPSFPEKDILAVKKKIAQVDEEAAAREQARLELISEQTNALKKQYDIVDILEKKANVSVDDRIKEIENNAAKYRKALEFVRKESIFQPREIKNDPESNLNKKIVNNLLRRYDTERLVNDAIADRIKLEAELKVYAEKIKEYPKVEILAQADADATLKRLENIRKEIKQVQSIKPQNSSTATKLAKLQTEELKAQIKLYKIEEGAQRKQIKFLQQAADYTKRISDAQITRQRISFEIENINVLDTFEGKVLNLVDEVERLKVELNSIEVKRSAYEAIEVKKAADLVKIEELKTDEARKRLELAKKQYELAQAYKKPLIETAQTWAEVFTRTGEFSEAMKAILDDFLSGLRQGSSGISGQFVGWYFAILQGLGAYSRNRADEREQKLKGEVEFDSKDFLDMARAYETATYPLLGAVRETNKHLQNLESIFAVTAKKVSATPLTDEQGRVWLSSLTSNGTDNYNWSDTSGFLGSNHSSRTLVDAGIVLETQRLGDLINANTAAIRGYATARFESSGAWGLFSSSSVRRETFELPDNIQQEFAAAFNEGYQTILTSAVALGFDEETIRRELENQQISIDFTSLYDLNIDEANNRIDEIFSTLFNGVVSDIEDFQYLVNRFREGTEDDLSALIRLSLEYQQAGQSLQLAGFDFSEALRMVSIGDIKAPTEAEALAQFYERFPDYNGQIQATAYYESPQSQVLEMVDLAGGVDNFDNMLSSYINSFLTEEERIKYETENLTNVLADFGLQLPNTTEEYRALMNAQDRTTEAGREAWLVLLQMAPTFADIADTAEEAGGALGQTSDYIGRLTRAVTADYSPYTSDQQAAFLERFAQLQDTSTDEGAKNYLDSLEEALRANYNMAPTVEDYIGRYNTYIDEIQRIEKEKNIGDLWDKADEILQELRNQTSVQEQASYQQAL